MHIPFYLQCETQSLAWKPNQVQLLSAWSLDEDMRGVDAVQRPYETFRHRGHHMRTADGIPCFMRYL